MYDVSRNSGIASVPLKKAPWLPASLTSEYLPNVTVPMCVRCGCLDCDLICDKHLASYKWPEHQRRQTISLKAALVVGNVPQTFCRNCCQFCTGRPRALSCIQLLPTRPMSNPEVFKACLLKSSNLASAASMTSPGRRLKEMKPMIVHIVVSMPSSLTVPARKK